MNFTCSKSFGQVLKILKWRKHFDCNVIFSTLISTSIKNHLNLLTVFYSVYLISIMFFLRRTGHQTKIATKSTKMICLTIQIII